MSDEKYSPQTLALWRILQRPGPGPDIDEVEEIVGLRSSPFNVAAVVSVAARVMRMKSDYLAHGAAKSAYLNALESLTDELMHLVRPGVNARGYVAEVIACKNCENVRAHLVYEVRMDSHSPVIARNYTCFSCGARFTLQTEPAKTVDTKGVSTPSSRAP